MGRRTQEEGGRGGEELGDEAKEVEVPSMRALTGAAIGEEGERL